MIWRKKIIPMDDEIIGWYIFKVRTVSGLFSLVMFVTMPGWLENKRTCCSPTQKIQGLSRQRKV
jgi:hypothetical protein